MSEFDLMAISANADFLSAFGDTATINGKTVNVIFEDEEFLDDTGIKTRVYLLIQPSDKSKFAKGEAVFVKDGAYKVADVNETDDSLIEVELRRA